METNFKTMQQGVCQFFDPTSRLALGISWDLLLLLSLLTDVRGQAMTLSHLLSAEVPCIQISGVPLEKPVRQLPIRVTTPQASCHPGLMR